MRVPELSEGRVTCARVSQGVSEGTVVCAHLTLSDKDFLVCALTCTFKCTQGRQRGDAKGVNQQT